MPLLLVCSLVQAETSVWKVSDGENVLYLGGTVHVLAASDLPLPAAFQVAFGKTDTLVLETDIAAFTHIEGQQRLIQSMRYSGGHRLPDMVSVETYQKLESYAQAQGLPVGVFEFLKPSGVAITLLTLELHKADIVQAGVDAIFYAQAKEAGRPMKGLETTEEHIGYVADMGEGLEDQFIRQTLADMGKTTESLREIVAAWRIGDLKLLEAAVISEMPEKYPKLYQELLVARNENWMPQIIAMLHSAEQEFILVGAAHLVGPDGLLMQLEAKGYTIRQME